MPMSHDQLLQMQRSARVIQERADEALMPWDIRAPAPVLGESFDSYRRNVAVKLKKLLPADHQLRKVQFRRMDDYVLGNFEPQLYKAVRDAAHDPSTVPPGEFRKVIETDQGGTRFTKWIGQESFVKAMGRPGRRVVSFRTDQGFVDASGRGLR